MEHLNGQLTAGAVNITATSIPHRRCDTGAPQRVNEKILYVRLRAGPDGARRRVERNGVDVRLSAAARVQLVPH